MRVRLTVLASTLAIGGAEQLLLDLLRTLDPARFEADVIYLREPGPIGLEIAKLGIPFEAGVLTRKVQPLAVFRLARMLRERGTQALLLVNHLNALFYGVAAAKLAGVPVVNWHNETNRRYRAHALVMRLRRLAHLGADRVVAAAEGHKRYVVSAEGVPARKVDVILNGVDTGAALSAMPRSEARRMLGLPEDAPVASIVAGLRPDKDHGVFLEAAALVLAQAPQAHFLIVGDGAGRQALEARAAALGLAERVRFLGFRRDIPDVLSATDVIVLSSRPWQETLSVAMLEAMAAGIPAVVTDVGFLSEVVREGVNGFLVPPGDPAALAGRMAQLMADPELRARLGAQAARDVGERCSLEAMAAGFERLFVELVRKRPERASACMSRPQEHTHEPVRARLLVLTTWADDGRWYFLNRLREIGFRVDLLEPPLARSRFVPARLRRFLGAQGCLWQCLKALAVGRRYDAVVTWNTRTGVLLGMLSRLLPRSRRPRHLLRDFHLDLTRTASPVYFLRVLMARIAAPCVDSFLTTSRHEADLYACMFGLPPQAARFFPDTPGGIYLDSPPAAPGSGYVFAFGNSDRDFDTLLEAAADIPRKVVILSQAWTPPERLPANVEFIGDRLPQPRLMELMAGAEAVVIPVKSHFVAAGQNAMLEVMCLAKPLVVTSGLSTLEHAEHGVDALFCPPRDARALAAAVGRLLDDPGAARAMGLEARKRALELPKRQVGIFIEELDRVLRARA